MKKISTLSPAPVTAVPTTSQRRHWHWQFRFSERRLLLMLGDLAASTWSVGIALLLWAHRASVPFDAAFILTHVYWFAILPALWLLLATANDYYNLAVAARTLRSLIRLAQVSVQLYVLYVLTFFLSPRGSLPRRFIVYYAVVSVVVLGLWRACRLAVIGWGGLRRRVVIVGSGIAAQMICEALREETAADCDIVGRVSSAADVLLGDGEASGLTFLGDVSTLPELVRQAGISELIVAYVNELPPDVFRAVLTCYEQGAAVVPMPALYEQITGRVPIEQVGEHLWTMVLPQPSHVLTFNLYRLMKRLTDFLLALAGFLVFLVALPVLAVIIVADSRGPVFYSQTRLGQGGRPFKVYKLRTMIVGAESGTGPKWASNHDPRVTRVGRMLRRTRLDEFPQLINVLRGDMSIVGPRPERPEFVDMLAREIPFYRTRLAVKPGLTGWAQVRYRYGSSIEDALRKLQYDLYYIRHQSIVLDAIIMLKTVSTILLFKGT